MSKTLPWRTLATPAMPSDLSAPSIALPWGSRIPDLRVTVTRAFIGVLQASIWHESVKPQAADRHDPERLRAGLVRGPKFRHKPLQCTGAAVDCSRSRPRPATRPLSPRSRSAAQNAV